MQRTPRLVIACKGSCWSVLRDCSAAPALAVASDAATGIGEVCWLPLEAGESGDSVKDWPKRLKAVAGRPAPHVVLLWVADRKGEVRNFRNSITQLGARMLVHMQRDRVPPNVAALIYVACDGIDASDALELEMMSCGGHAGFNGRRAIDDGLREILGPRGRPTYLMNKATRAASDGSSYQVSDIWPVEVARLLGSIEASPQRQPGLRAWRSMAFNPTRFPFERINIEAFHLARQALGIPDSGSQRVTEGSGRQLTALKAPESLVPTDRSPQHCYDSMHRPGARPEFPDWLALGEGECSRLATLRLDTSGSRGGTMSAWYRRFDERGSEFVNDRTENALRSLEETTGPRAVQYRAWLSMHDDAPLVRWYASGQFYVGPSAQHDSVLDGLREWEELGEIERRLIAARQRSVIESEEVDRARNHFMSLPWRFVCAASAAVFIATVFSAAGARNGGFPWLIKVAAMASFGSLAAAAIVLSLEWRAGRRGRHAAECSVLHGETCIAEGFLERMLKGARGELSGRRRRWFQAAARARDSAHRLYRMVDVAEQIALRQSAADKSNAPSAIRGFVAATTVESSAAQLPLDELRKALDSDPAKPIENLRLSYATWWAESMRQEDPLIQGAVASESFQPRVIQAVGEVLDSIRQELIKVVDRMGTDADADWGNEPTFSMFLGPGDDLRNLGVRTERAHGRAMYRVILTHAALPRHATEAANLIGKTIGHSVSPQAIQSNIDRWGCLGLMIDDISIGFRAGHGQVLCCEADGSVNVWEGMDQFGPVAAWHGGEM